VETEPKLNGGFTPPTNS